MTTLDWRLDVPGLAWQRTVYHGPALALHAFDRTPSDYLAFVGRFAPPKRPDLAIAIARRAKMRIEIAAKMVEGERAYYGREIAALPREAHARDSGEVGGADKDRLPGNARVAVSDRLAGPFWLVATCTAGCSRSTRDTRGNAATCAVICALTCRCMAMHGGHAGCAPTHAAATIRAFGPNVFERARTRSNASASSRAMTREAVAKRP